MKVVQMTPHEHDRRLALASHLTQAVASSLMATQTLESIEVSGPGLVDTTRLAGADPALWTGILLDNRPAVLEALDRFSGRLTALRRAIARADAPAIARLLRAGSSRRSRLLARRNGDDR
jgi:prephenate dehydrogenase